MFDRRDFLLQLRDGRLESKFRFTQPDSCLKVLAVKVQVHLLQEHFMVILGLLGLHLPVRGLDQLKRRLQVALKRLHLLLDCWRDLGLSLVLEYSGELRCSPSFQQVRIFLGVRSIG